MSPRFDPSQYPGSRPDGPVLVVDDEVLPLRLDGPSDAPLQLGAAGTRSVPVLEPGAARFGVAYGSNASPARLMDKQLTSRGAILLPAVVRGWVAAFEARRTGYGAVPLTFVPSPGAVTDTWVLGLVPEDLPRLDRTEGRVASGTPDEVDRAQDDGRFAPPGTYQLGRVGDVRVAGRFLVRGALAYLPGPATRVQRLADDWRTYPASDQSAAAAHVDSGGPAAPAPPPTDVVLGDWPGTPLEPGGPEPGQRGASSRP
jgi:hypothetical protein